MTTIDDYTPAAGRRARLVELTIERESNREAIEPLKVRLCAEWGFIKRGFAESELAFLQLCKATLAREIDALEAVDFPDPRTEELSSMVEAREHLGTLPVTVKRVVAAIELDAAIRDLGHELNSEAPATEPRDRDSAFCD